MRGGCRASAFLTTNLWSSELAKLVANAFLAQRISSINSISALCETTGADVDEVARAIGTDSRIGPKFLKSSVGFGGSCFQKDILNLVYLCGSFGIPEVADYWDHVVRINDWQKSRYVTRVIRTLFNTVSGQAPGGTWVCLQEGHQRHARVAGHLDLQGVARRAGAPGHLRSEGRGVLRFLPISKSSPTIPGSRFARERLRRPMDAHGVLVLTEWDEFRDLDFAKVYEEMHKPAWVFDGRNVLDMAKLKSLGFYVYSIGKPHSI